MIEAPVWFLEGEGEGLRTLTALNNVVLLTVSLETLEMLGRMFLDEVEDAEV